MALEQTMFVGDTPEILVDVIVDGQHVAATIDGTTTRVDGNAAAPSITTIGDGNYIIGFPSLTPAPVEGDTLYVKVNGSIDSSGEAWTEAVYKLKVLPQIVTAMDGKIDTIDSVVDDVLVDTGSDIPSIIANLNDFDPSADTVANVAYVSNPVTTDTASRDASKADVSGLATQSSVDTVDAEVGQIKAKTDQLTFTVSNQVDANALTGGSDATAANQTTIISHLTDVKGTGWVAADSLAEIAEDVAGLNGDAMRGTDGANTVAPLSTADLEDTIDSLLPISANLTQIQGHNLSSTGTQLADAFETFFNVAAPLSMTDTETLLRLAASAVGAITVVDNGTTIDMSFKDTDGTTEVRNLTYTKATGARSQN